ncbi:hypothetical protein RB601_002707 [Gaeumannomyces tritici]
MTSYRPQRPRGEGGGGGVRDSYHPRDDGRRGQYRPQPNSYSDYSNTRNSHHPPPPGFDSFHPPQGEFTFRAEKPSGIQESRFDGDGGGGRHHRDREHDRDRDRNRRSHRPDYGRRGAERDGGGRGRPYHAQHYMPNRRLPSARPILTTTLDSNKELSFKESASGVTYRTLGELSDSDDAEMDISDNEQEGDSEEPSGHGNKKRRLAAGDTSGNSVPKWSNPDPYTAAPPPDISQQKKKDVVQLIRKARVQPAVGSKPAVPESADFISCNLDDSDDEDYVVLRPDNSGRGDQLEASLVSKAPPTASLPRAPTSNSGGKPSGVGHPAKPLSLPNRPPPPPPADLGSRKRTHDDEIKVPDHAKLKKHSTKMSAGVVSPEWQPVHGGNSCPWVTMDHSELHYVSVWLDKEIKDFYDYVKPTHFEEKLRQSLVDELVTHVRRTWNDASVYPFGSFKSGLYLPTGDMDLVFCSDKYLSRHIAQYTPKKQVFHFARFVEKRGLAHQHRVERIHKARVPLVKYVDARTGLKVDISFENSTGITAVNTFLAWKEEFPAMPILVTVIKHFLAMRGLNEPVNGGLGGFSVICLVVSMLQMMPEVQSRAILPGQHLGELLLHFFDLYGNKFQYQKMAISLKPPRYVPKNKVQTFAYKNSDRFSIIDPNDPENDISGGSSNSHTVQEAFSRAYDQLRDRIAFLARSPVNAPFSSVLEPIFAGNYTSFEDQRRHMQTLWDRSNRGRR